MNQAQKIREGINYLRLLNRGQSVDELADELMVSPHQINECIKAAREHKDAANRPPKVVLKEPHVKIYKDLGSGEFQVVQEIEVELLRDIIVKFDQAEHSEFQTMLPVKISIKRKKI